MDDPREIEIGLAGARQDSNRLACSLAESFDDLRSVLGPSQRLGRADEDAGRALPADRDEPDQGLLEIGCCPLPDPTVDRHLASKQQQFAFLLDAGDDRAVVGACDGPDQQVDSVAADVDRRNAVGLAHVETSGVSGGAEASAALVSARRRSASRRVPREAGRTVMQPAATTAAASAVDRWPVWAPPAGPPRRGSRPRPHPGSLRAGSREDRRPAP